MATKIKLKRSTVAATVPTTSNLVDGEVALNIADKKLYARNGSNIIEVANQKPNTGEVVTTMLSTDITNGQGSSYYVASVGSDVDTLANGGDNGKHPDTPFNNSTHDMFLTKLYDDEKGILFLAIDNDEIIATNSAIVTNEKNIKSIKYPHRLHIRKDYSHLSKVITNKDFDQLLCNWILEKNISNLYCTFNEKDYLSFMWSAIKHKKRKQNKYINEDGQKIIKIK